MRAVVLVQRVVLSLLLIPPVIVVVDAVFTAVVGDEDNPISELFGPAAEWLTPEPLTTVFEDQGELQTAVLVVLFYAVVILIVALLFRLVRALASR